MSNPTVTRSPLLPAPVRPAAVAWLAAVGAGVAETAVHLALPEPPTLADLAVRGGVYAVVVGIVLSLRTGRDVVRWALVVLLGGVGTLSLVIEPVTWLALGGSPGEFLATADAPTLAITALRVAHLLAVGAGIVLMFRPAANAFFRRRATGAAITA